MICTSAAAWVGISVTWESSLSFFSINISTSAFLHSSFFSRSPRNCRTHNAPTLFQSIKIIHAYYPQTRQTFLLQLSWTSLITCTCNYSPSPSHPNHKMSSPSQDTKSINSSSTTPRQDNMWVRSYIILYYLIRDPESAAICAAANSLPHSVPRNPSSSSTAPKIMLNRYLYESNAIEVPFNEQDVGRNHGYGFEYRYTPLKK